MRVQNKFFCHLTYLKDHVSHCCSCKATVIALGPKVVIVTLGQRKDKVSMSYGVYLHENRQSLLNSYQAKH